MLAHVLLVGAFFAPVDVPAPPAQAPFEVETVKGLTYCDGLAEDAAKHKLDLYLPRGKKDFPVFFFVHGGSWRTGDRSRHAALGSLFARFGIGAVIISYRLAPHVHHPAQIEDVANAFAWTHAHIAQYGGRIDQNLRLRTLRGRPPGVAARNG